MPPRRFQLTALAVGIVQMVDGAEINLRVRRPQSFERREKRVVRSAERRQMQEIDAATGGRNRRVQQHDGAAEIGRLARWPAAQGAEAAVIPERDLLRDGKDKERDSTASNPEQRGTALKCGRLH